MTCTSHGVYSSSKTKSNLEWYFTHFKAIADGIGIDAKFNPDDHPGIKLSCLTMFQPPTENLYFVSVNIILGSNLTSSDDDAMLMHTSILTLPSVTMSSSGNYKCFVQTNTGSYSKSVDLKVVPKTAGETWPIYSTDSSWL